ncbi:MAG TPA: HEAT repeat domain-containing protein [Candidatus Brocadiia bacterium]|mgnify:CR=1 FL=1|nr:HEAT repeat domain-containing protein [Candidatus Brocadiia bacterium]
MTDCVGLVEMLRSFRTRKEAMDRLVEQGEAAVGPLVEALASRNEGVRWAAARCLGEIGSREAAPRLIELLDSPSDAETARGALTMIFGADLGGSPGPWRDALAGRSQKGGPASQAAEDERLLAEATRGLDATVTTTGGTSFVEMLLADGRRQKVRVVMGATDSEKSPIVIVYTECAPADPKLYEFALRTNLSLPYGALALREVDGRDRLVLFNSLSRECLSPQALRKTIVSVAEKGDQIERRLTGQDAR